MKNQMISDTLLGKREEWQNNTISEMQEKLNSHPTGRYLVADYKKSLVVVYGNSQIGKTSLILNMMGILPEFQRDVYSVLRAKQEYGDSSTVTAIIYLVSPCDDYGLSFSDGDQKEITFFDGESMIRRLSSLREDIENGASEERILYIFVPQCYFSREVLEKDTFSIMDLPGINSRNELEKEHVDSIVSRYMSMATVKMIVTKGDSIQDLASIDVPEGIDWRAFPNRYFIVVTMAFSQGSVKNYFNIKKEDRTQKFLEYVRDAYSEIHNIIQSDEMEWYPIDVGDSFRNLLQIYENDAEEIVFTQQYFTKSIREAIVKRNGNGLQNIIADLKSYSNDYYRVNINKLRDSIKKKTEDIQEKKKYLQTVVEEKDKYRDMLSDFTIETINRFKIIEDLNLEIFWEALYDRINGFVQYISDNYPIKIMDHDLVILNQYIKFIEQTIDFCNEVKKYIGDELFENMFPDGISLETWEEMKDLLVRHRIMMQNMFRPKGVNFFLKTVNRTDVISQIKKTFNEWYKLVYEKITVSIENSEREIEAEKDEYFQISQLIQNKENEGKKLNSEIQLLEVGLEEEENELYNWEIKEKTDKILLSKYREVARREYNKSKEELKSEMRKCTMPQRLQYLFVLGLMEKDFNAIVEEK